MEKEKKKKKTNSLKVLEIFMVCEVLAQMAMFAHLSNNSAQQNIYQYQLTMPENYCLEGCELRQHSPPLTLKVI